MRALFRCDAFRLSSGRKGWAWRPLTLYLAGPAPEEPAKPGAAASQAGAQPAHPRPPHAASPAQEGRLILVAGLASGGKDKDAVSIQFSSLADIRLSEAAGLGVSGVSDRDCREFRGNQTALKAVSGYGESLALYLSDGSREVYLAFPRNATSLSQLAVLLQIRQISKFAGDPQQLLRSAIMALSPGAEDLLAYSRLPAVSWAGAATCYHVPFALQPLTARLVERALEEVDGLWGGAGVGAGQPSRQRSLLSLISRPSDAQGGLESPESSVGTSALAAGSQGVSGASGAAGAAGTLGALGTVSFPGSPVSSKSPGALGAPGTPGSLGASSLGASALSRQPRGQEAQSSAPAPAAAAAAASADHIRRALLAMSSYPVSLVYTACILALIVTGPYSGKAFTFAHYLSLGSPSEVYLFTHLGALCLALEDQTGKLAYVDVTTKKPTLYINLFTLAKMLQCEGYLPEEAGGSGSEDSAGGAGAANLAISSSSAGLSGPEGIGCSDTPGAVPPCERAYTIKPELKRSLFGTSGAADAFAVPPPAIPEANALDAGLPLRVSTLAEPAPRPRPHARTAAWKALDAALGYYHADSLHDLFSSPKHISEALAQTRPLLLPIFEPLALRIRSAMLASVYYRRGELRDFCLSFMAEMVINIGKDVLSERYFPGAGSGGGSGNVAGGAGDNGDTGSSSGAPANASNAAAGNPQDAFGRLAPASGDADADAETSDFLLVSFMPGLYDGDMASMALADEHARVHVLHSALSSLFLPVQTPDVPIIRNGKLALPILVRHINPEGSLCDVEELAPLSDEDYDICGVPMSSLIRGSILHAVLKSLANLLNPAHRMVPDVVRKFVKNCTISVRVNYGQPSETTGDGGDNILSEFGLPGARSANSPAGGWSSAPSASGGGDTNIFLDAPGTLLPLSHFFLAQQDPELDIGFFDVFEYWVRIGVKGFPPVAALLEEQALRAGFAEAVGGASSAGSIANAGYGGESLGDNRAGQGQAGILADAFADVPIDQKILPDSLHLIAEEKSPSDALKSILGRLGVGDAGDAGGAPGALGSAGSSGPDPGLPSCVPEKPIILVDLNVLPSSYQAFLGFGQDRNARVLDAELTIRDFFSNHSDVPPSQSMEESLRDCDDYYYCLQRDDLYDVYCNSNYRFLSPARDEEEQNSMQAKIELRKELAEARLGEEAEEGEPEWEGVAEGEDDGEGEGGVSGNADGAGGGAKDGEASLSLAAEAQGSRKSSRAARSSRISGESERSQKSPRDPGGSRAEAGEAERGRASEKFMAGEQALEDKPGRSEAKERSGSRDAPAAAAAQKTRSSAEAAAQTSTEQLSAQFSKSRDVLQANPQDANRNAKLAPQLAQSAQGSRGGSGSGSGSGSAALAAGQAGQAGPRADHRGHQLASLPPAGPNLPQGVPQDLARNPELGWIAEALGLDEVFRPKLYKVPHHNIHFTSAISGATSENVIAEVMQSVGPGNTLPPNGLPILQAGGVVTLSPVMESLLGRQRSQGAARDPDSCVIEGFLPEYLVEPVRRQIKTLEAAAPRPQRGLPPQKRAYYPGDGARLAMAAADSLSAIRYLLPRFTRRLTKVSYCDIFEKITLCTFLRALIYHYAGFVRYRMSSEVAALAARISALSVHPDAGRDAILRLAQQALEIGGRAGYTDLDRYALDFDVANLLYAKLGYLPRSQRKERRERKGPLRAGEEHTGAFSGASGGVSGGDPSVYPSNPPGTAFREASAGEVDSEDFSARDAHAGLEMDPDAQAAKFDSIPAIRRRILGMLAVCDVYSHFYGSDVRSAARDQPSESGGAVPLQSMAFPAADLSWVCGSADGERGDDLNYGAYLDESPRAAKLATGHDAADALVSHPRSGLSLHIPHRSHLQSHFQDAQPGLPSSTSLTGGFLAKLSFPLSYGAHRIPLYLSPAADVAAARSEAIEAFVRGIVGDADGGSGVEQDEARVGGGEANESAENAGSADHARAKPQSPSSSKGNEAAEPDSNLPLLLHEALRAAEARLQVQDFRESLHRRGPICLSYSSNALTCLQIAYGLKVAEDLRYSFVVQPDGVARLAPRRFVDVADINQVIRGHKLYWLGIRSYYPECVVLPGFSLHPYGLEAGSCTLALDLGFVPHEARAPLFQFYCNTLPRFLQKLRLGLLEALRLPDVPYVEAVHSDLQGGCWSGLSEAREGPGALFSMGLAEDLQGSAGAVWDPGHAGYAGNAESAGNAAMQRSPICLRSLESSDWLSALLLSLAPIDQVLITAAAFDQPVVSYTGSGVLVLRVVEVGLAPWGSAIEKGNASSSPSPAPSSGSAESTPVQTIISSLLSPPLTSELSSLFGHWHGGGATKENVFARLYGFQLLAADVAVRDIVRALRLGPLLDVMTACRSLHYLAQGRVSPELFVVFPPAYYLKGASHLPAASLLAGLWLNCRFGDFSRSRAWRRELDALEASQGGASGAAEAGEAAVAAVVETAGKATVKAAGPSGAPEPSEACKRPASASSPSPAEDRYILADLLAAPGLQQLVYRILNSCGFLLVGFARSVKCWVDVPAVEGLSPDHGCIDVAIKHRGVGDILRCRHCDLEEDFKARMEQLRLMAEEARRAQRACESEPANGRDTEEGSLDEKPAWVPPGLPDISSYSLAQSGVSPFDARSLMGQLGQRGAMGAMGQAAEITEEDVNLLKLLSLANPWLPLGAKLDIYAEEARDSEAQASQGSAEREGSPAPSKASKDMRKAQTAFCLLPGSPLVHPIVVPPELVRRMHSLGASACLQTTIRYSQFEAPHVIVADSDELLESFSLAIELPSRAVTALRALAFRGGKAMKISPGTGKLTPEEVPYASSLEEESLGFLSALLLAKECAPARNHALRLACRDISAQFDFLLRTCAIPRSFGAETSSLAGAIRAAVSLQFASELANRLSVCRVFPLTTEAFAQLLSRTGESRAKLSSPLLSPSEAAPRPAPPARDASRGLPAKRGRRRTGTQESSAPGDACVPINLLLLGPEDCPLPENLVQVREARRRVMAASVQDLVREIGEHREALFSLIPAALVTTTSWEFVVTRGAGDAGTSTEREAKERQKGQEGQETQEQASVSTSLLDHLLSRAPGACPSTLRGCADRACPEAREESLCAGLASGVRVVDSTESIPGLLGAAGSDPRDQGGRESQEKFPSGAAASDPPGPGAFRSQSPGPQVRSRQEIISDAGVYGPFLVVSADPRAWEKLSLVLQEAGVFSTIRRHLATSSGSVCRSVFQTALVAAGRDLARERAAFSALTTVRGPSLSVEAAETMDAAAAEENAGHTKDGQVPANSRFATPKPRQSPEKPAGAWREASEANVAYERIQGRSAQITEALGSELLSLCTIPLLDDADIASLLPVLLLVYKLTESFSASVAPFSEFLGLKSLWRGF